MPFAIYRKILSNVKPVNPGMEIIAGTIDDIH